MEFKPLADNVLYLSEEINNVLIRLTDPFTQLCMSEGWLIMLKMLI